MEDSTEASFTIKVEMQIPTAGSEPPKILSTEVKITKADANVNNEPGESWFSVSVEPGTAPNYDNPKVVVCRHGRNCPPPIMNN